MNNLVIDLEMCRVPRDFRSRKYNHANETIQIGAVLLDENFKRIGTLSQYVHPEYGVIDPFIQDLTGIHNSHVKSAPKIQDALIHMLDWIGNREYKVYAWSSADRDQLLKEIKSKHIKDPRIDSFIEIHRWTDYQALFSRKYNFDRCLSLQEALARAEVDTEGRFHDGLDDAINTGYLIEKLEMNPGFQLAEYKIPEKHTGDCVCSIGEVLANLNLKFA